MNEAVQQKMKKSVILIFVFAGAFLTGCASQKIRTSNEGDRHAILPSALDSVVPLPERTPYDSNPELKAIYLEGYVSGYKVGVSGYRASCDIAGSREHPERSQAYIEGNFAGQDAGSIAWEAKEKLNQSSTAQRP